MNHLLTNQKQNGSALALAIILTTGIGIIATSILSHAATELKLQAQHELRIDARNAAESLAEYTIAEIMKRAEAENRLTPEQLKNNPIEIPSELKNELFQGSYVDLSSLEIKVDFINDTGEWMFLSGEDPANYADPLAGKSVWVRTLRIAAKAKAVSGKYESTAHATDWLLIRDLPLLNYAIFYNMDAEFYPQQKMSVFHHVHVNGNMYTGPNKALAFNGNTTMSGNFFVQKSVHQQATGKGVASFLGTKSREGKTLYDSNFKDWDDLTTLRYGENTLLTGVAPLNPIGVSPFIPDDPDTLANEFDNSSYSIIEPILPKIINGEVNPDYKGEVVRDNKIAYEAGLILRVEYNTSYDSATQPTNEQYVVNAYKYNRSDPNNPNSSPIENSDGSLAMSAVKIQIPIVGNSNANFDGLDEAPLSHPEGYSVLGGRVTGGAYDGRQRTGMDMFTIDMSALATAINTNDQSAFTGYNISKDWNGVVYFEFPTSSTIKASGEFAKGTSGGRIDKIVKAVSLSSDSTDGSPLDLGLQIINAQNLPRPSVNGNEGFTFATNGPLYTIGSYNADGNITLTSDSKADVSANGSDHDVSAALISDTFTPLSVNWKDGRAWSNYVRPSKERTAVDTEISAALITGSTPSRILSYNAGGKPVYEIGIGSGGVQNFIRKHETWKDKTLAYRGSLVSFFHSEAHPRRLQKFFNGAPTRRWGYHEFFSAFDFPPGLPLARDYRRTHHRLIHSGDYDAL